MKAPGIYQIRHNESERVYVGSAVNVAKRWLAHKNALNRGNHHNSRLQAAWTKSGAKAFTFTILDVLADSADILAELLTVEQWWMNELGAFHPRHGFNACRIAGSSLGLKFSDESRARMSAAQIGKKHTPETRAKMRLAHKGRGPDAYAKLASFNMGRVHSPETRAKMSASRRAGIAKRQAIATSQQVSTVL